MEKDTFHQLVKLLRSKFGTGWLNNEFDQQGFSYDLERALAGFDGTYSVRHDDTDGQIVRRAVKDKAPPKRNYSCRTLAKVCEQISGPKCPCQAGTPPSETLFGTFARVAV